MNRNIARGKIRVFIVDDHPIVRRGLQLLLSVERDFAVCGDAASHEEGLARIKEASPDVAIVDLNLWGKNGLELVSQIREQCPSVKVLIFTMYDNYEERAMRAGAHGYVTKEQGGEKAIEAARALMDNRTVFSPALSDKLLARISARSKSTSSAVDPLTEREVEILDCLGAGLSSREVAEKLNLSVKTVQAHRENIKRKLGLTNASQLVNYACSLVRGM